MLGFGEEVIISICSVASCIHNHDSTICVAQHRPNMQLQKIIGALRLYYYYAQNNSCTYEIVLANEDITLLYPPCTPHYGLGYGLWSGERIRVRVRIRVVVGVRVRVCVKGKIKLFPNEILTLSCL